MFRFSDPSPTSQMEAKTMQQIGLIRERLRSTWWLFIFVYILCHMGLESTVCLSVTVLVTSAWSFSTCPCIHCRTPTCSFRTCLSIYCPTPICSWMTCLYSLTTTRTLMTALCIHLRFCGLDLRCDRKHEGHSGVWGFALQTGRPLAHWVLPPWQPGRQEAVRLERWQTWPMEQTQAEGCNTFCILYTLRTLTLKIVTACRCAGLVIMH